MEGCTLRLMPECLLDLSVLQVLAVMGGLLLLGIPLFAVVSLMLDILERIRD